MVLVHNRTWTTESSFSDPTRTPQSSGNGRFSSPSLCPMARGKKSVKNLPTSPLKRQLAPSQAKTVCARKLMCGHHPYLSCLFLHVALVDANGIDPEPQGCPVRAVSEEPERITQVERDLEDCTTDEDVGRFGVVAPHTRQSLIPRTLAELGVPDGALDIGGCPGLWAISR